ncbi:MAG: MFS transporter [Promethearchaeota archaeon]|nr:MAG: MFS transporter [Candidatus Lokiarchaeota archaeon]
MNETITFNESDGTRHSRLTFLSNAFGLLCATLIGSIQGFTLVYYETVLGLNAWLVFLAMSIFLVYNGVNDPIFGFLIDRNLRFTRKWGRRFPWIVIGIIPWAFSVFLHFSAPTIATPANPWPAFWWLLLTLILLDTFGTIVNINYKAVQMEKFRTEYERRRFTKYYAPIDILAILLGMLLPSLFIDNTQPVAVQLADFSLMGGVVAIVALLFGILSLHGNREDKIMIDRFYSPNSVKRMKFLKVFKEALKSRTYMVYFIFATCLGIQITLVVVNVWYLTTYVLQAGTLTYFLVLGLNLLGTLISIPFWLRYIKKINNNKKALIVAGLASCAALFALSFFVGAIDLMILAFILGLAQGGLNSYIYTIISPSVTEDVIVKMGKNQKGVLFGISALLGRFVASIDELIIAVVHNVTGFLPGYPTYDAMAAVVSDMTPVLIGIRLLQGVIPALVLLLGVLVIWKFFPLTQERILSNKAKMQELGF